MYPLFKMKKTIHRNSNTESTEYAQEKHLRNNKKFHYGRHNTLTKPLYILLLIYASITHATAVWDCPKSCECTDVRTFCVGQKMKTFASLPSSTVEVYLFNNNISNIPRISFQPLSSLKILDLTRNGITDSVLWDGIFSNKQSLEHINLSKNKLTRVGKNLVSGLTNLKRLYLQNNLITTIEEGAFNNLTSLVELKISYNGLGIFPALHTTPNLLLIDASHNKITELEHQAFARVNLEKLFLGHNRLTEFRNVFDVVSKLEELDISSNRLTAVPRTIRSLTNMIALNMSNNNIDEIPSNAFEGHTRLKDLDLTSMSLTTLQQGFLPNNIILNFLRLGNNPWKCDCDLAWLYDFIRYFSVMFNEDENLKCASPSKLRGRLLNSTKVGRDIKCAGVNPFGDNPNPTTTTAPKITIRRPTVDACDGYTCLNGGTCHLSPQNYIPSCRCLDGYTGSQCQTKIYIPTTSTKTTTTTKAHVQGSLVFNPDSVTENSVQILLPRVSEELYISIKEKLPTGKMGVETTKKIQPETNSYTVQGLEAGRAYNICVSTGNELLKHDVLCGQVQTKGVAVFSTTMLIPKLKSVPTTTAPAPTTSVTEHKIEKAKTDRSVVDAHRNNEMGILFPILGAGCGVLIILICLLFFFMCYRSKRSKMTKKHPHNNNTDTIFIPGGAAEGGMHGRFVDMEMSPLTKHGSRGSSLKNGTMMSNGINGNGQRKGSQNQPMNFTSQRHTATPNSSSSSSSNSNCGTLPMQQIDNGYHYQQPHMNGDVPYMAGTDMRADYVYRTPSQSSPTHALHATHYDKSEDMRPLMMQQHSQHSMQQYYPQEPTPPMTYIQTPNSMPQMRGNYPPNANYNYPVRSEGIVYTVGDMSTPQHHQKPFTTRSAFQPIPLQSTHASQLTMASQCAPIMTQVNTAHVIPVTSGIGMMGNGHLYQEGVA